jgi:hypothetical protein
MVYRRIESGLALERSKNRNSAQQVSQPEPQITRFSSSSRFDRGPVTLDVIWLIHLMLDQGSLNERNRRRW